MKTITIIFVLLAVVRIFRNGQAKENPPSCPPIVTKANWGGKPAKAINVTIIPIKYVIIHHTVTPICSDESTCVDRIANIQDYHMNNLEFDDIGYNFVIGGDGNVYEGAGWHKLGAHTRGYNTRSLGIGFIGDFTVNVPDKKQLEAGKKFLECAVDKGEIDDRYKLLGARSISATESPGLKLFKEINRWKGFTLTP